MRLRLKTTTALTLVVISAIVFCLFSRTLSTDSSLSYQLVNHPDGSMSYRLNVAVSDSLHQYYVEKSHEMGSSSDFPKFVTPYALKPIADRLWEIYADDEDFADGALMVVHQIPYKETGPAKYPVETVVGNEGDCDLFSYIAASIMKAGGLDVVLFYYESQSHMNLGVSLSHAPHEARSQIHYVTSGATRYYVAECTGGQWKTGWRVGECPDTLKDAPVEIVTLDDCEQSAPGQISASYRTLKDSTLSLGISSAYIVQGSSTTFSGQLAPASQDEIVTVYIKVNGLSWAELVSVQTDSNGKFAYSWRADAAGICYVRASWSGNDDYAGADSATQALTILPMFLVLLLAAVVVLCIAGAVMAYVSKRNRQDALEMQSPQVLS